MLKTLATLLAAVTMIGTANAAVCESIRSDFLRHIDVSNQLVQVLDRAIEKGDTAEIKTTMKAVDAMLAAGVKAAEDLVNNACIRSAHDFEFISEMKNGMSAPWGGKYLPYLD